MFEWGENDIAKMTYVASYLKSNKRVLNTNFYNTYTNHLMLSLYVFSFSSYTDFFFVPFVFCSSLPYMSLLNVFICVELYFIHKFFEFTCHKLAIERKQSGG